jgi:gamma-glutamylcyclotransferase (GGCT)/AIG2-like uncharacterized protein YtfP
MKAFKVFVFGSLKKGGQFDQSEDAINIEEAKCHGFQLWLTHFPFMLHGGNLDYVHGELHEYNMDKLPVLDHIEGHPNLYERREVYVETNDGAEKAYAYFLVDDSWSENATRVPDDNFDAEGDYRYDIYNRR